MDDKRVIEVLGRFSDKLSIKGLVRFYLLVHPLVDLEDIIFYFFSVMFGVRKITKCVFVLQNTWLSWEKRI